MFDIVGEGVVGFLPMNMLILQQAGLMSNNLNSHSEKNCSFVMSDFKSFIMGHSVCIGFRLFANSTILCAS